MLNIYILSIIKMDALFKSVFLIVQEKNLSNFIEFPTRKLTIADNISSITV